MDAPRKRAIMSLPRAFLVAWILVCSTSALPQSGRETYVEGELLVKFRPETQEQRITEARDSIAAKRIRHLRGGLRQWKLPATLTVADALPILRTNQDVEYAEPNYLIWAVATEPNDPAWVNNELWALRNDGQGPTGGTPDADIDAELAWDVTQGNQSVIVGIMDSGIEYTHPDLVANMWSNAGEVVGNNLDDDLNGFIEDVHGYDFNEDDIDPIDEFGHGTSVSGIVGAVGNNALEVVGVNWHVDLMALKVLSSTGLIGDVATAIRALDYARDAGAHLTNNSWGGNPFSQALEDAIRRSHEGDMAFVAAAGNESRDTDAGPFYPASYEVKNVIAVAATDWNDEITSFSNFGLVTVDLGAPGDQIVTTVLGGGRGGFSGTSAAAPFVAGVAALLRSLNTAFPGDLIRSRIISTVDPVASLDPNGPTPVASGGRLNAFQAVDDQDVVAPGAVMNIISTGSTGSTIQIRWTAPADDGYEVGTATAYQVRYSRTGISAGTWLDATRTDDEPTPGAAGSLETMTIDGLAAGKTYYIALKAYDEWGNGQLSNVLPCATGGVCTASFCRAFGPELFQRCTFTGSYGACGCCKYTCQIDPSCLGPDPCPPNVCSGVCP